MICISIGEYGFEACSKALRRCERHLKGIGDVMAEIRLDLCGLSEDETGILFSSARLPLMATCVGKSNGLCEAAALAGASYVDINVFTYKSMPDSLKSVFRRKNVKVVLSFHDYLRTPSLKELVSVYKEAVEAGADIVKIVTMAETTADAEKVLSLYRMHSIGELGKTVPLEAFAMGVAGRYSRFESYFSGAPFLYCALRAKYALAPGMPALDYVIDILSHRKIRGEVSVPASKSIAQRAIIAAVMAKGNSEFHHFTRCRDTDSAVAIAKQLAGAYMDGDTLVVKGSGFPLEKKKGQNPLSAFAAMSFADDITLFVGESGLLSRLCIPIAAQSGGRVTITGEGSLLGRHMYGCKEAMEDLGASCLLTAEETLPAIVSGPIRGGEITLSGKKGSQFISGLLMALPLCRKDSVLTVQHPTSIPYIMLTMQVMRDFGIEVSYSRSGDDMIFTIPGRQRYSTVEMTLERDWSSAANFVVLGAIYGDVLIDGLEPVSMQADREIINVVKSCGAIVTVEQKGVRVTKGHLRSFRFDATDAPDLFPILSVLAAYSEGTSEITGIARLKNKESDRPAVMAQGLQKMGVKVVLEDDRIFIEGISLSRRIIEDKMLKGCTIGTYADHRVAMAFKVASIGCPGKVVLDNLDCIEKSFPSFLKILDGLTGR